MVLSTGCLDVDEKLKLWLSWDKNEGSRSELSLLAEKNDVDELRRRLCSRLEFGTAGLRGQMAAGFSRMNDLVIIQTSQGLAKYLLMTQPKVKDRGVIIGYDARHNSQRFAWLAAAAMISCDIPVYLFSSICPTPFVAFGVLEYNCVCGIMVTASHNPKEDNGYKVYWDNGAQIIPPHDKSIASSIMENLEPWRFAWKTDAVDSSLLVKDPMEKVRQKYYESLAPLCHYRNLNSETTLKITYSAMHGVGYEFAKESLAKFGFRPPIPVNEQVVPDPEFPTVKFPNPEEGKSALDLSMKTASENNSSLILANDPDADRLAVAEKMTNGEWKVFTGNELGALFGWWIWKVFKEMNPEVDPSNVYMLSSTVSSKILNTMAKAEGFNFIETLTGFKWMGNEASKLMEQGKTVLFAFEEAIGFMCGSAVLDKDGVSACAVIAESAAFLHQQGLTLNQQLQQIYTQYGHHISRTSYFFSHHKPSTNSMFDSLRNQNGQNVRVTACGPYQIVKTRDLTTGYDDNQLDKQAVLPVSKSSNMITFWFENGCVITMRDSGTEPKIKYYMELCSLPGSSLQEAIQEVKEMEENLVRHFFQPEKYNFIART